MTAPAPRPSRRILRAPWPTTTSDEEARALFQERLGTLFKLMFWSIAIWLVFLLGLYASIDKPPRYWHLVFAGSAVGVALMVSIWFLLRRRRLSLAALYVIDLVYSGGIGAGFGASAILQWDLKIAGYFSLVYSAFAVYARALIVPSSGTRTALASITTYVPMGVAAFVLALTVDQDHLPGPAYFTGFLFLAIISIWLSAAGSQTIYGLRRVVNAAQQLGQYTLERKIGEGGMGTVYLGRHVLLRRPTAIKVLPPDRLRPDDLERFEREVQHTSRLSHPNTIAVYDFGRSLDGTFYYAMEYLGGGIDLENLVRKHGAQPNGRVAAILEQICGALAEAHEAGIVHRDIKPANIMLCERGGMPDVVKVLDFGLVKELTADVGASTQVIMGTPHYVAPEVVTDLNAMSPAVDLYALGAVGYFLLTGKRVFDGKTAIDVCMQHVKTAPQPPSQVAARHIQPELEAIVMRCLAKQPSARFASAGEMAEALRALPPARDWDLGDARRWWRDARAAQAAMAVVTQLPTTTITVDLGHRSEDHQP